MQFIDTHAHFDLCLETRIESETELVGNLATFNIIHAVQISIDTKNFYWSYNFALQHRHCGILFTIGIHPSSLAGAREIQEMEMFTTSVMNSKDADLLFGIGETGLDYYRLRRPKEEQQNSFETQIAIAKKFELPIIVHCRDAARDCIAILKKYAPLYGIMHCFSENVEYAKKIIDVGMHISFAGNITYKSAHKLHEAATYVPIDRLFLETDAPFLAPIPFRGKSNRPQFIAHTYAYVAKLRNIPVETLAHQIAENFNNFIARHPNRKEQNR
ncbi:MAG: TatD family hydrolase [Spirochaetes bacterium]|nr:TatD family hydrolase [Spirochaetota bacterium]